jgi:hypothetical protein
MPTRQQIQYNIRNYDADLADEDEAGEDDEEELAGLPAGPQSGARALATTTGRQVQTVANPARAVAGVGVGAVNNTYNVMAGVGAVGHLTGTVAPVAGAALSAAAPVLGPIGIALMIADIGLSAFSAAKTYAHICALEAILEVYNSDRRVLPGTIDAIVFATQKKNKKLKRKGVGCIPVLGSICNTVYTLGRRITKKDRGVERRRQAQTLWENMLRGDPAARAACRELLGEKTFTKIQIYADGHVVLKKKMKSL